MKSISVKKLCEELWEIEKNYKLLDLQIQNIYIWEVIRFGVFTDLSNKLGVYGNAHTSINSFFDKLKVAPKLITNAICKSPFKGSYNLDFLIYDHPRKVNIEGINIDIYTNEFIKSQTTQKFDVIEGPFLFRHSTSSISKNRKYLDHEILNTIIKSKFSRFSTIRFNIKEKYLIEELQTEFIKRFNVNNFNLKELIANHMKNFRYRYKYHKRLFQKRKPKSIFIVVSYGNIPVIAAAKDLGIKVIEFQHGVITDYHFAYNFSETTKRLKYFPDKILTFGEYWANTKGFPKQTEVEVYGFPYLNQQLESYKGTQKKKNQVLFLSQGTIGKQLSKQAKEVAESMPDYHFIYKLHPGEYDRWRNEYPDLVEASNLENLEVIDNNKKNLYSFFGESEYQFGVYSTAIFEGLTLNCKTILFNLPGIEYMTDLIEQGIVEVVYDKEEAIRCIKNYDQKKISIDYFFREESKRN